MNLLNNIRIVRTKILVTLAYQSKSMIQMLTCSWRITPWNDNTLKENMKFQLLLHLSLLLQEWGMGWGDGIEYTMILAGLVFPSFYYCNLFSTLPYSCPKLLTTIILRNTEKSQTKCFINLFSHMMNLIKISKFKYSSKYQLLIFERCSSITDNT